MSLQERGSEALLHAPAVLAFPVSGRAAELADRFRVLDAGSPEGLAEWTARWHAAPRPDVMAHPEFARLFARPCDRVVCATYAGDDGVVLLPLLLRPVAAEPWARSDERRWDATTPYGYGGPFAWGEVRRGADAFWRAYAAWCGDERIVTTFARLSLFADELAPIPGPVEERGRNVVVSLEGGEEALWRGYEPKVRKWIAIAEQAGLDVVVDPEGARLDAFHSIYTHTMERREAKGWYFFPRSLFEAIVERLAGHFVFFHTVAGGDVVSSDLVLHAGGRMYYFLGGTDERAFPLGPNYLLKHRTAVWGIAAGQREWVLGGGLEPNDGLFRYKRAFARKGVVPFRTAGLVHDEAACDDLARARAAHAGGGWQPQPGYFPPYRG